MRLPSNPVTTLHRSLRDEVRQNYRGGRVMLAVDGLADAGQSVFADGLAAAFAEEGGAVFRASIDGFLLPRAERPIAPDAAYDHATFRRILIDPFRTGEGAGFQLAAYDPRRDAPLSAHWTTAPRDAVLVVDGAFLLRPAVRGVWHWSVWLDAPAPPLDIPSEQERTAASALVDNADPARPVRVFGDFC